MKKGLSYQDKGNLLMLVAVGLFVPVLLTEAPVSWILLGLQWLAIGFQINYYRLSRKYE